MKPDELRKLIDTIVVVMLENRSFDHVLGFLSHEDFDARRDIDGLHQHDANFDWGNPDDAGNIYRPCPSADGYLPCDLPHARDEVQTELHSGAMDGFVQAYFRSQKIDQSPVPMAFCAPDSVPVTAALARGYCVCDKWFASLPNDTLPNRLMALSGTTLIDSTATITPPTHFLPDQRTIFDWLSRHGRMFEIYVDADPILGVVPSNLLLMDSQWTFVANYAYPFAELAGTWTSAAAAPDVIYCEPFYNDFATVLKTHGNCNHPPFPMAYGEAFLKRVYDTLTSNLKKWARTVMVVCYDEHGGFFDHRAPPAMKYAPPPDNQWVNDTPFETLGVRIPAIVVSPLVNRGSAFHGLLDHTSILQLMVDRFGGSSDLNYFGDAQARKNAGVVSLSEVLTRQTPRTDIPKTPPAPVASGAAPFAQVNKIGTMFSGVLDDLKARQQP